MTKKILFVLFFFIGFATADTLPTSGSTCSGRFPNPITNVCWSCIFPISIGGLQVGPSDKPDTSNPSSPVCTCPLAYPPYIRIGLSIAFWEPVRLVDVTRRPGCFVNLGGMEMKLGLNNGQGRARAGSGAGQDAKKGATYQVHWYIYPLTYLLNVIVDTTCKDTEGFDLAYMTEVDPLWDDDELTFLLNPEASLFANPIAQAVCAADCVATTTGIPMDALFWCAGCQGSMYPLDGNIDAHHGGIDSSVLAVERMTYKLHREGILWGSFGPKGMCGSYVMPVMKKSQYRSQLMYPIPSTSGTFSCNPYGRSTVLYESGKEYPIKGEHFGYLIWRKRNCCASAY